MFCLCFTAYDVDGVYIPVPENIIEYLQGDPASLAALSDHQSHAPEQDDGKEAV